MTRTILIALVFLILAGPALADDPRFLIERIEVRNNKRVSSAIIISESLLREGVEYSESELADANARLTRLPFLLTADFALEKGSERGRHVLVISVTETKPFFYDLDLTPVLRTDDLGHENIYFDTPALIGTDATIALGFRFFVGRRGALHLGLIGTSDNRDYTFDDGGFAVGYTQYDLFGTRAFATLNLKHSIDTWSPQLVTGIPLSVNQNLTLTYDESSFSEDAQRLLSLRWSYNTTNHPFLPTAGTLLYVTPVAVWRDEVRRDFSIPLQVREYVFHSNALGLDAGGAHYWQLSERDSVSAAVEVGTAQVDERREGRASSHTSTHAIVETAFQHSLWDREQMARGGDSRVELKLAAIERWRPGDEFRSGTDRVQATVSWIRRSSWGILRLGVGYGW